MSVLKLRFLVWQFGTKLNNRLIDNLKVKLKEKYFERKVNYRISKKSEYFFKDGLSMGVYCMIKVGVAGSQTHFFFMSEIKSWGDAFLSAFLENVSKVRIWSFFEGSSVVFIFNRFVKVVLQMFSHVFFQ